VPGVALLLLLLKMLLHVLPHKQWNFICSPVSRPRRRHTNTKKQKNKKTKKTKNSTSHKQHNNNQKNAKKAKSKGEGRPCFFGLTALVDSYQAFFYFLFFSLATWNDIVLKLCAFYSGMASVGSLRERERENDGK
jgi:hypothetical protein